MPGIEKLRFNCGVCSSVLTDDNALFTSCGHFFCRNKRCTVLVLGSPAGKCEQCGQECDAGTLENRAERYDDRVKSFVFASLPDELRKAAEILEFRDKHMNILSDNANSLAQRNAKLKEEITRLMQENTSLRSELEKLKQKFSHGNKDDEVAYLDDDDCAQSEVTPVREVNAPAPIYAERVQGRDFSPKILTQQDGLHTEDERVRKRKPGASCQVNQEYSRRGYVRNARGPQRHVELAAPRQQYFIRASPGPRERKNVEQEAVRERRHEASGQIPKAQLVQNRTASSFHPPPVKPHIPQGGKQVQAGRLLKGSRNPLAYQSTDNNKKRGRSSLCEMEQSVPRSHAHGKSSTLLRRNQPGLDGSYSSRYARSSAPQAHAASSYAGGPPSSISRLARISGQRLPNRPYASSLQKTTRSFATSWQARVSNVPRPSVTPDQLERMRKRARPNNNPLAPRRL